MKLRGDMKPAELAKAAQLTKSGVAYILDGTTRAETIRATTIDRIATALAVNRDWLLYGTEPMVGAPAGPGVAMSYVARLDPGIVQPAVAMARTMVASQSAGGSEFDPLGDVPLFIAAYELMADATVENRARFDVALTARVLATTEGGELERSTTKTRRDGKKRGK